MAASVSREYLGVIVGAKGIDTTGVKFKWTPLFGGAPQSVVASAACGGPNNDAPGVAT